MGSDSWMIRHATPDDLPAVVALNDALFQEDSGQRDPLLNHDWAKTHGADYFSGLLKNPNYTILVAEHDATVIGYLAGSNRRAGAMRPVPSADLESMFVLPAWRSSGVGRHLAITFLDWARDHGVVWVTVTAYAANTGACAFYERIGFGSHTVTLGQQLT
ncbi:MAG: GNAT family N-acetyltransferase [Blastochloris sp.]|nr:GNAT family N-acetyltransferase [Blastochloris sp.]